MKKIILFIILICYNQNVFAINFFETSFYDVEFTSNNIQSEKIKKINQIKLISILEIFNKTLIKKDFENLSSFLSQDFIDTFIKNIIIDDEKIINNKYYSKIKINFEKKKIITFFRQKKLSYVVDHPEKFLLIIHEQNQIATNLFSKNNSFYLYLKKNFKNESNFKIPNLDINDRYILNYNDLKNKDLKKIRKFSNKYNINEILIVLSEAQNNQNKYKLILYSDGEILEKNFNLSKNDYKNFFKILSIESIDSWKTLNKIQNEYLNIINCNVNYFNIFELKEIRNNFAKISTIQNLYIKSLSYKNIEYDIYFYGNLKILNKLLNLNKLKINYSENYCRISLK